MTPLTPAALRRIAQRATRRPSTVTTEELRRDVMRLLDEVRRLQTEREMEVRR